MSPTPAADTLSNDVKQILVVEDDPFIGQLICDALNDELIYHARVVADGLRALDVTRNQHFDLIILDISLPSLDGFGVYERLQANPATANIPVLFISAAVSRSEIKRRSIPHFLAKPFELDDLFDYVSQLMR